MWAARDEDDSNCACLPACLPAYLGSSSHCIKLHRYDEHAHMGPASYADMPMYIGLATCLLHPTPRALDTHALPHNNHTGLCCMHAHEKTRQHRRARILLNNRLKSKKQTLPAKLTPNVRARARLTETRADASGQEE